jgi:hypothetical protein
MVIVGREWRPTGQKTVNDGNKKKRRQSSDNQTSDNRARQRRVLLASFSQSRSMKILKVAKAGEMHLPAIYMTTYRAQVLL